MLFPSHTLCVCMCVCVCVLIQSLCFTAPLSASPLTFPSVFLISFFSIHSPQFTSALVLFLFSSPSSSSTLHGPFLAPFLHNVSSWQMRPLPGRKQRCIKGTTPEGPVSQTTQKSSPLFSCSQPFFLTSVHRHWLSVVQGWVNVNFRYGDWLLSLVIVSIYTQPLSFAGFLWKRVILLKRGTLLPIDRTDSLFSYHTWSMMMGSTWRRVGHTVSEKKIWSFYYALKHRVKVLCFLVVCLSVPLKWKQYLKNTLRRFLQNLLKHPLRLKGEQIRSD